MQANSPSSSVKRKFFFIKRKTIPIRITFYFYFFVYFFIQLFIAETAIDQMFIKIVELVANTLGKITNDADNVIQKSIVDNFSIQPLSGSQQKLSKNNYL